MAAPFKSLDLRKLVLVACAAFALRVALRGARGAEDFWANGYGFYFELAHSLARGDGYGVGDGVSSALRVPLYPVLLALVTGGERAFGWLLVAHSLIGAGTVVCGALLAAELVGAAAALPTAVVLAAYPYYVVHDTALQETALFTWLTTLSVVLLVRARRRRSTAYSAGAGLTLAAALLTRATLAPFVCIAPLWLGVAMQATPGRRLSCALLCAGALGLGTTPWLLYTESVVGAPVLGTETGHLLWRGHNEHTFRHYPEASMDVSAAVAARNFSVADAASLESVGTDELLRDRWYRDRALAFMSSHPVDTTFGALRKLIAAFGVLPSPRHGTMHNLVYALSWGPVLLLGLVGMAVSLRGPDAREHALVAVLLLTFAAVTALFFGHTSHRAFLDVYFVVYACVPALRVVTPAREAG